MTSLFAAGQRGIAWVRRLLSRKHVVLLLLPLFALLELGAHVYQLTQTVPPHDWRQAKRMLEAMVQQEDLLMIAPRWAAPQACSVFGPSLCTIPRLAAADTSRFPRAVEVSLRGTHLPEFVTWKELQRQQAGKVTIRLLKNPAFMPVREDLVDTVAPERMEVMHETAAGEQEPCVFVQESPQAGNLGTGPAIPGEKFVCPHGEFVGVTVVTDREHRPRRCLYTRLTEAGGVVRIRFLHVTFGATLHGHHTVAEFVERNLTGAPITLRWLTPRQSLAGLSHVDGEGWKSFAVDTLPWQGTQGDLVAEIQSSLPQDRPYCFEATLR